MYEGTAACPQIVSGDKKFAVLLALNRLKTYLMSSSLQRGTAWHEAHLGTLATVETIWTRTRRVRSAATSVLARGA